MDYYDALLGGADPNRMKETARQLRRQEAYGTLGALTGDPVLSQFGTGMIERSGERAQGLQKARQAATTARSLGAGHYEQGGEIKEIPGYQESLDKAHQNKVLLQTLKNEGKGGDEYHKMPKWVSDEATAISSGLEEVQMLTDEFKDEYTQTLGPGPQSKIPNVAARYGITVPGVPQTKEAQEWWAKFRRLKTLPDRNEIFGATLAFNEKQSWDEIDINPSMDAEQIRTRMKSLLDIANRAASRSRKKFKAEGYRPGTLEAIYGEEGPEGTVVAEESGSWGSAEDVRNAFQNGDLTQDQATEILKNEFGFE